MQRQQSAKKAVSTVTVRCKSGNVIGWIAGTSYQNKASKLVEEVEDAITDAIHGAIETIWNSMTGDEYLCRGFGKHVSGSHDCIHNTYYWRPGY